MMRSVRRRRLRSLARFGKPRFLGWMLLLAAGVIFAAAAVFLLAPLPLPAPKLTLGSRPEPARFYDRTGRLLTEAGSKQAGQSQWYSPGDASGGDCVLSAFLAARDVRQADWHPGDSINLLQAMGDALLGRNDLAGESAAELLASEGVEPSAWNRARLSAALAARYDRRQMAEWLINVRLYGNATVGVDDAALTIFQSHAGTLSAGECAALEALAANPTRAQSLPAWEAARDELLNRMMNFGYIQKETWQEASAEPMPPAADETGASVFGGNLPFLNSFLSIAVSRLGDRYPPEELPRSGLRVYTSLDLDFEMQVLCAAQNLISQPAEPAASVPTLTGKPCDLAGLLGPATGLDVP